MNFAKLVKQTRKNMRLTQVEFANRIKTTQSVVSKIESGKTELSAELLLNIGMRLAYDDATYGVRFGRKTFFFPFEE